MGEVDPKKLKGGYKKDEGKVRFDLMAFDALEEAAKVMTLGASKYAPYNWAKGMDWHRPFRAAMNHGQAFWRGEDRDPETGLLHTAHALCNNMFLTSYLLRRGPHLEFDDRPHLLVPANEDEATVIVCPACQGELECIWKWCAHCGRALNW